MPSSHQPKLRLKDRRRRLQWVKVAAGSAVVLVSLAIVWSVSRLPEITVAEVEVSGTELVEASVVKDMLEAELAGTYFFLVPRANSLVFPKTDMLASLKTTFPEIARVSIVREGWEKITATIVERNPVALWCSEEASASCYLMDENGFIFAKAPTDAALYVRFLGIVSEDPIGSQYLAGDFAEFKSFVEEVSSTAHRTPQSVLVEENDDVSIAFVQGGVLKFVRALDHEATLDNIASVFASRGLNSHEKLEYADFRFGNKVYVKFVEE